MAVSHRSQLAVLLLLAVLLPAVHAVVYVPGMTATNYEDDAPVEIKVRELTSSYGTSHAFYSLPFCAPDPIVDAGETFGEYLMGTTIQSSLYSAKMKSNSSCNVVCRKEYTAAQVDVLVEAINENYRVHMITDNLPSADGVPGRAMFADGIAIGGTPRDQDPDSTSRYLLNHYHMILQYHVSDKGNRIVGFYIQPLSVKHEPSAPWNDENPPGLTTCPAAGITSQDGEAMMLTPGTEATVFWTYDVEWQESDTPWAKRWNVYLTADGVFSDDIHWWSIANSFIILLFLTGMVAMILVRALYKDLSRYNRVATDEEKAEDREETGWKLVHAEVFRAPVTRPMLFCIVMGVSAQVLVTTAVTIVCAVMGVLSPANHGALATAIVLVFLATGVVAGYTASRSYKTFNHKNWQRMTLGTALLFPGSMFSIIFLLNLFLWGAGSTSALPFGDIVLVLAMWLLLSVPLVFVGAYFGFKRPKYEFPVAVGRVPRPIPEQRWYLKLPFTMMVGGILPFGAVFVEVVFILTSIWTSTYYYYVFGFLFLSFIILIITCSEMAIVLTYFQLCAEDYHWWWRSFMVPGAAGVYLFVYSMFYYVQHLSMSFLMSLLYVGYMGMLSVIFGMCCGVAGHYACFWFTRKIYAAVKVD